MRRRGLAVVLVLVLALAPAAGPVAASPTGMVAVADSNVSVSAGSPVDESRVEGAVLADAHADTLLVDVMPAADVEAETGVAAVGSGTAVVLTDDIHSDGRRVAIDAGLLRDALGFAPEAIRGVDESGSTWTRPASYQDGYLVFDVPHFSTNVVTFSGTVSLSGTPATNGTTYTYDLASLDAATAPNVTLTGRTATEEDIQQWTVTDSETVTASIAGNQHPSGPADGEPELTVSTTAPAIESTADVELSELTTADWDGDGDADVIGRIEDTGTLGVLDADTYAESPSVTDTGVPVDFDAEIAAGDVLGGDDVEVATVQNDEIIVVNRTDVTDIGYQPTDADLIVADVVDFESGDEVVFNATPGGLQFHSGTSWIGSSGTPAGGNLSAGQVDQDGTDEVVFTDGGDLQTYDFESGNVSDTGADTDFDVAVGDTDSDGRADAFVPRASLSPQIVDLVTYSMSDFSGGSGGSAVAAADIDSDGTTEFVADQGTTYLYDPDYPGGDAVYPAGLESHGSLAGGDLNSDGGDEIAFGGSRSPGEPASYYDPYLTGDIDVGDNSSLDSSPTQYPWTIQPWADTTLTLSNLPRGSTPIAVTGEPAPATISLTYQERLVTEDPTVRINGNSLSHAGTLPNGSTAVRSGDPDWLAANNTVRVSVAGGGADAPTPAVNLSYSHQASDSQSVQYRGGTWVEQYRVNKTYASDQSAATLTVPFESDVAKLDTVETRRDGGDWSDAPEGDYQLDGTTLTVDIGVVAAGETVGVRANGTAVDAINGSIRVIEPTDAGDPLDSRIRVTGRSAGFRIATPDDRVLHVYESTWASDDAHMVFDQDGRRLHLPDATAGVEARVTTVPVAVRPQTGDVRIQVERASATEPALVVQPLGVSGDTVEFTYLNAQDGQTWQLRSSTAGTVRDSATANSPVTLVDDDSDETLVIEQSEGSSGGGGSGSGGGPLPGGGSIGETIPTGVLVVLLIAVPVVAFVGLRYLGYFSWPVWTATTAISGTLAISLAAPQVIDRVLGGVEPLIPVAGIGLLYLGYRAIQAWRAGRTTVVEVEADGGGDQ